MGELKKEWITSENGITSEVIKWAKEFAENLATDDRDKKKLSTSQLRRFFGQLKRIKTSGFNVNDKTDLYMLKAQLAYANGRDKKLGKNQTKIDVFYNELSSAIDYIQNEKHFRNFVNIVEAIVAYHKAAGGE